MFRTQDDNRLEDNTARSGEQHWGLVELSRQRMFYLAQFEERAEDGRGGWLTSCRTAMTFDFSVFEPFLQAPQDGLILTDLYCIGPRQKKSGRSGWEMSRVVEVLAAVEQGVPGNQARNVFVTKNGRRWSDSDVSQEARHLLIGHVKHSLIK